MCNQDATLEKKRNSVYGCEEIWPTNQFNKFTEYKAFSLIEMAIVLVVMSIALGFGLSFFADKTDHDRIIETKKRITIIERALNAYMGSNQSIPCPAWGSLNETDSLFGVARSTSGSAWLCDQDSSFNGLRSNHMAWGMLPVTTLELDNKYAYDAWGHKFSYIMIEYCNANTTISATYNFASDTYCGGGGNALQINDASGSVVMSDGVMVIISHGKNGHGAFKTLGGNKRQVSYNNVVSSDELENSHLSTDSITINPAINSIFVERSVNMNSDPSKFFSNIIFFKNKQQLISSANSARYTDSSGLCNVISYFNSSLVDSARLCGTKTSPTCQTYMDLFVSTLGKSCY